MPPSLKESSLHPVASRCTIPCFGLASWIAVGVALFFGSLGLERAGVPPRTVYMVNAAAVGLAAALLVMLLMLERRGHRRRMAERSGVLADLNHHVRNAITVIQYQSAVAPGGPEAPVRVDEAVHRIEEALRSMELRPSDRRTDAALGIVDLIRRPDPDARRGTG